MHERPEHLVVRVWGSIVALFVVAACNQPEALSKDRIGSSSDLVGEGVPYLQGNLILAGTVVPVAIEVKASGDQTRFDLVAHGETIEKEIYGNGPSGYSIIEAGGESYVPPVPILRFPLDVGDRWKWSGTASSGPIRHQATAEISTSREELNVPGGPYSTVRVKVELKFSGTGAAQPTVRNLDFWFAPGKGVVKRQFGASSTREPRQISTK